jgi:protein-S-isoprenylcysteine O-methyltransferase Ste14
MSRWTVPGLFAAMAFAAGARALAPLEAALAHASLRASLIALYFLLRVGVAVAFATFTLRREEPHRHAREPLALLACAAAMLLVLPFGGPGRGASTAMVFVGDLLAVGACAWLLASVLALGRCFGILPEARGLVTRGPYRLVRHPVYLGEILALLGLTVSSGTASSILALVLFVAAQAVRMRLEERALTAAFPDYALYAARTARLLPRLARNRAASATPDLRLVRPSVSSVAQASGGPLASRSSS